MTRQFPVQCSTWDSGRCSVERGETPEQVVMGWRGPEKMSALGATLTKTRVPGPGHRDDVMEEFHQREKGYLQ